MEDPTFTHHGDQGYPSETRESHWLPALRPDGDEDLAKETDPSEDTPLPAYHEETTLPIPPSHSSVKKEVPIDIDERDAVQAVAQTDGEHDTDEGDERLDPAWGFKRTNSAQILDTIKRTSSFPTIAEPVAPLTLTQPVENGLSLPEQGPAFNELLNGVHSHPADEDGEIMAAAIHDNKPFESSQPSDELADARFEEGIPLIATTQTPSQNGTSIAQDRIQESTFGGVEDDDASFFSNMQTQPFEKPEPIHLERKSTNDVLDFLHPDDREIEDKNGDAEHTELFDGDDQTKDILVANPEPSVQLRTDETDSKWAAMFDNDDQPKGTLATDSKWAAMFDDDEEFLVDDADELLPDSEPGSPSSFLASLREDGVIPDSDLGSSGNAPNAVQQTSTSQRMTNSYTPHQPSTSQMTDMPSRAVGSVGLAKSGLGPMGSFQTHLQQPAIANRAESFADQAKGGYKSPYDMPIEFKPKKRPQTLRPAQQQQGVPPPPPRSSSMSSQQQQQSPFTPSSATFGTSMAPTVKSPPASSRITSAPSQTTTAPARQSSTSSSFFEELPITSKPRPASNSGRYTPAQNATIPPPQLTHQSPPIQQQPPDPAVAPPQQVPDPYAQFQLHPPERLDPFANVATQPTAVPARSTLANRYSPAPGAVPGASRPVAASSRYSPAPPALPRAGPGPGRYVSQPVPGLHGQTSTGGYTSQQTQVPPPASTALPFMPRTSSPLAYQGKPTAEQAANPMPPPPPPKPSQMPQNGPALQGPPRQNTPPPITPSHAANVTLSPQRISDAPAPPVFSPPRRSITQSPGRQMPRSALGLSFDMGANRPASAHTELPNMKNFSQADQTFAHRTPGRVKAAAPELDFEQPQDETQHDQLQRWRGAPILKIGFGGTIVSSFPKHTPRYKAGQIKPQIKSTVGDVKSRSAKDLSLLPEHVVNFPGPLKGKSKKKDLLSWMSTTITKLESEAPVILGATQTLPDPRKCHDELILLWKIVRIFVEFDGVLDKKPEALKALNIILSPEVHAIDESTASQYRSDIEITGIYRPGGMNAKSDSVDALAVENVRKHLLKGERDQAVWKAADSRLWSHALLIASTMRDDRKTWRQVVQEFVRQEVKTIGNNSESLSALYEIFGGNMEESIDQLVPPSARAGLQMVSTVDASGPTKNALDGLDRWKETLSLVLNNRTLEDQRALASLGALLADYGRVQAAHICFLFARNPLSPNIFGGIDDPQASITLLGSDRRAKPFSFHQDHDAILLTEAFEFAISSLAPAQMAVSLPHLSAYKLQRALDLADNGLRAEAQAYCDAIASGVTSKAKVSPYYHTTLLMEVDDLAKRLKQVPVQSTSWMAKPSVEKATNSLLSKLSNFVAGDDSDAESKGSAAEVGPFAKTSGSPGLSRSGSQTDLYGSYPNATSAMPISAASSRYAPGGVASARSSSDLNRGRPSLDSQRSPPSTSHGYEPRQSIYVPSSVTNALNHSPARSVSSYQPYGTSPSRNNYQATPPQPSYMPDTATAQSPPRFQAQKPESYLRTAQSDEQSSYVPAQPEQDDQLESDQPPFKGYNPSVQPSDDTILEQAEETAAPDYGQSQSYGYGYEPPADTGYVPYQPEPDSDDDSKNQKLKKKSFMDDDDDYPSMSKSAVTSRTTQDEAARKKANDEAADAAFRAAAEADAQRAKDQAAAKKSSGSWLGGWFGGKKTDDATLDSAPKSSGGADQKVFKAKLGEDKMKLYYDKDLKKWVNPDDPDSMKAKSATPPPPPGRSPAPPVSGPPRMGGTPAPPMLGSRPSTPASTAGGDVPGLGIAATLPPSVNAGLGLPPTSGTPRPPSASGAPAPPAAGGLAPPSRPASNASSIDDLIGPATGARKSAKAARGAKKGRYVDVMAQ